MNVTLSVDEHVLREARRVASSMKKSLNQLIREYLERLTAQADIERDLEELEELSRPAQGDSQGWRFDRDEIHERS